jgi:hypothetical protein
MRQRVPLLLLALALAACGSDDPSDETPSLVRQVEQLFPAGAARDEAVGLAEGLIAAGAGTAAAEADAFDLAELTMGEYYGDRLSPARAQQPAAIDALISGAFDEAGLPDPALQGEHFDDEGLVAVVRAAGGTFVAPTPRAGIQIPVDAAPRTALLAFRRLPDSSQYAPLDGPLPTSLDQYPLFYDFSFTPEIELAADAIIGICQFADPASAYYPADGVFARLRLAHPDPADRSTIAILELAEAPFLDCDGTTASLEGLMALRRVGIGGRVRKFSPFAAVDRGVTPLPPGAIDPVGYRSFTDSPFNGRTFGSYFHLEDYEDGALSTPGVTASSPSLSSSFAGFEDSVDGDDGAVNGTCLKAGGARCNAAFAGGSITYTFSPELPGGLPTHVGIVWTDGGVGADVTFEAFDAQDALLARRTATALGDNSNTGTVEEDRFFGIVAPGGVRRIVVSNTSGGTEVDHLQYGR